MLTVTSNLDSMDLVVNQSKGIQKNLKLTMTMGNRRINVRIRFFFMASVYGQNFFQFQLDLSLAQTICTESYNLVTYIQNRLILVHKYSLK